MNARTWVSRSRLTLPVARRGPLRAVLVGLTFMLAGLFWAVSSPAGSSPDDTFHLGSIWCAAGESPGQCESLSPDVGSFNKAMIPERVVHANCYAYVSTNSGECVEFLRDDLISQQVNAGLYPPLFYRTLHLFAGDDVGRSVLAMRLFNLALGAMLLGLAVALASPFLRRAVVLAWLGTFVPLVAFFVPSTNPSSWLIIGMGTYWAFLLRFLGAGGRARWLAGGLAVLTAAMSMGARSDGAPFICVATVAVILLSRPPRTGLRETRMIVPAVILAAGALLYFRSSVSDVVVNGLGANYNFLPHREGVGLLLSNVVNYPNLLLGVFGVGWGLGWIDTPLPPGVGGAGTAVAFGLILIAATGYTRRKALAVALVGLVVLAVPLVILQQGGSSVGENVQPRYLLPLVMVGLGLALISPDDRPADGWILARGRAVLLIAVPTLANALALHTNLRRYLTGLDEGSLNLNKNVEWWWQAAPTSPMVTWLGGTIAGLLFFWALAAVALGADLQVGENSQTDGTEELRSDPEEVVSGARQRILREAPSSDAWPI